MKDDSDSGIVRALGRIEGHMEATNERLDNLTSEVRVTNGRLRIAEQDIAVLKAHQGAPKRSGVAKVVGALAAGAGIVYQVVKGLGK